MLLAVQRYVQESGLKHVQFKHCHGTRQDSSQGWTQNVFSLPWLRYSLDFFFSVLRLEIAYDSIGVKVRIFQKLKI